MPAGLTMNQPPRLFANVPGRDVSADRHAEFDIGHAYYEHRHAIAEDLGVLKSLMAATRAGYDLAPPQWAQWYSVALGFQPDLIVELGRSKGNSTALFCQAASRLGRTRVVSLCNSRDWVDESLPRIQALVAPHWLAPLDARITDILDVDYGRLFEGSGRVLLLWDAHGFEIAEVVLGRILPLIADRPHLVLMHDISDNRYAAVSRSYEEQPIWKGSTWDRGTGKSLARVNIGWMNSLQDQVIAVADFAVRNDIEIGSADHEYAEYFGAHPQRADEMQRLLGDEVFSVAAHYAFFSLAGKQPPFHYPAVQLRFRHQCDAIIRDIHPKHWLRLSTACPRTIHTNAVSWEYAAVMACRPREDIPADARRSLKVHLQVVGASVGVGLLTADQSAFAESRQIPPGLESAPVFLPVTDTAAASQLVVHTWDVPAPARVRIEAITFVW
jgi:hypothetical protein